ncbi:folylpolyglutamate synthase/dihydrofolate synthase family protein [Allomuricauda sp. d1]|uniref:bifunctional folylpolyglutamate synthase/dihydrofolate synthase n=1 Tax=Allomuricauda sp. d1 TaxID=3136725 RepID=UPI0031D48D18
MTYQQTLDWMFAQLPMYQHKGISALNNKLENIQNFCAVLDNPHQKFKSIHVAGTNGKGSSCHMLASVLQEAGYKVGLYTSPHLKDFRERIKINGKTISKKSVISFIKEQESFLEEHQLSFFEMTVGMAFEHFASEKVDIAVIEVGLGGRLDSTNIICPEVSLITNIGYDHTHILGDTLEKIALEKGGIIKRGMPVVVSERQTETEAIFKMIAAQKDAPIFFADENVKKEYKTDLLGHYQKKNIAGVVTCLNQLAAFGISENNIVKGLKKVVKNTGLLGRWQVLHKKPLVVCDTAHNPEGIKSVMYQMRQYDFKKLHMVIGFVDDKKLGEILPLFPKKAAYYFVRPNMPRGLDAVSLKEISKEFNLKGESYESVEKGVKTALQTAKKEDFIFIGGSTFVVAEVV